MPRELNDPENQIQGSWSTVTAAAFLIYLLKPRMQSKIKGRFLESPAEKHKLEPFPACCITCCAPYLHSQSGWLHAIKNRLFQSNLPRGKMTASGRQEHGSSFQMKSQDCFSFLHVIASDTKVLSLRDNVLIHGCQVIAEVVLDAL